LPPVTVIGAPPAGGSESSAPGARVNGRTLPKVTLTGCSVVPPGWVPSGAEAMADRVSSVLPRFTIAPCSSPLPSSEASTSRLRTAMSPESALVPSAGW
jgi:hypothetical protein